MPIKCEVVSQDRMLYDGHADAVVAPGEYGELGILPNHAPLLAILDYGILRVRYQGEEEIFTISGGVIEVQPDVITILADVGENVHEIDLERAEAARTRAEALLHEGLPEDTDTYLAIQAALRRSQIRIDAAKRFRHTGRQRPTPAAPPKDGS
jgi:F-type H+-transporting ATPase subunit epsilon